MPAYSFQQQFIPAIESGLKTHTIRAKRKQRPRPLQPFYGFYAMRTKQCRRLFTSTITKVGDLVLTASGRKFAGFNAVVDGLHQFGIYPQIEIDGIRLADDEMEALAIRDGFKSLFHMSGFWDLNKTFNGDLIHWKPVFGIAAGAEA